MLGDHLIPKAFNFSPDVVVDDPAFLFADGFSVREVRAAASEARRHRLVKASKSPTREKTEDEVFEYQHTRQKSLFKQLVASNCYAPAPAPVEHEYQRQRVARGAAGCSTVFEFREWQEAWRVRTQVESTSARPPEQSGPRVSSTLSGRAASKIAESCEYMHAKRGGFKTFVTGTLNAEARARLITCEIVRGDVETNDDGAEYTPIVFSYHVGEGMQREITRTMDALQKMYRRGWITEDGREVAGHDESLPYLWVVEIPENAHGAPNPHVHMLLGWGVEFKLFREWAARIEKIWGNGTFHLEKIKDSSCAGAYMAKAAGYLCKAQGKNDQGMVIGNRYAISKTARAPAWVQISRAQIDSMGQLIADIYDHLTVTYGEKYAERRALNNALINLPKEAAAARATIGKRIFAVRQFINSLPIRCNKYQVVIKGQAAAVQFFSWIKTPKSENANRPEWLPEMVEGWEWRGEEFEREKNYVVVRGCKSVADYKNAEKIEVKNAAHSTVKKNKYFTKLYENFARAKLWRRLNPAKWVIESFSDAYWHSIKNEYFIESNAAQNDDDYIGDYYSMAG